VEGNFVVRFKIFYSNKFALLGWWKSWSNPCISYVYFALFILQNNVKDVLCRLQTFVVETHLFLYDFIRFKLNFSLELNVIIQINKTSSSLVVL